MIHFITEGGNGNKELKTHRWFLPDGVRHHLEKIRDDNKKEELSKNHTTKEAWDHLEFILDSEKGIAYNEMKRIKNWFDKNYNATKTKQYELYGGNIMKTWVENQLNSATLYVKKHKEAQRAMGKENAFIKPHEADRQNTVSKVDSKVPTYNPATLNKQNRLKELSDLHENKVIVLDESQRMTLKEAMSNKIRSDFFQELDTYASVDDYNDCVKLCRMYFGHPIGIGSSRIIFQMDDEKILKVAYKEDGVAQNKVEIEATNKTTKYKAIFPQIFNVGCNNIYYITEYVLPLRELGSTDNDVDDIRHCLGLTEQSFYWIIQVISKFSNGNTIDWNGIQKYDKTFVEYVKQFTDKNQNLKLLLDYLFENPILSNESFCDENMGMVTRNGKPWIVILDNGWDGEVAKRYGFDIPNFGELNV